MLTESQKRALRAKVLLDSGTDPRQAAKECGYTSVNAMLGAVMMCDGIQAMPAEEHEKAHGFRETKPGLAPKKRAPIKTRMVTHEEASPAGKTLTAAIYPVESGKIIIRKNDIAVSYRPEGKSGPTVHIIDETGYRHSGHPRWLALVGKDMGGKTAMVRVLRQISEAALECAALIEDEIKGGK